jgi:short-chain fatty acids transporter
MYYLGKKSKKTILPIHTYLDNKATELHGAEKLDHSKIMAYIFGGIILAFAFYKAFILPEKVSLDIITPNYINLVLLGLAIMMHSSFYNFLNGIDKAISGSAGILIQFPLYFGIMGIMNHSGMVQIMSDFFVSISNSTTFPIFTFISAAIINVFVPSGGGQWAVQGPIIIDAATQLGVNIPKSVMALAYGDQLTNMLQPFWALPLLGITGLKAKEILPYTLILLVVGTFIFISGLLIF